MLPNGEVCFVILAINPSLKSKLFLKKKITIPRSIKSLLPLPIKIVASNTNKIKIMVTIFGLVLVFKNRLR